MKKLSVISLLAVVASLAHANLWDSGTGLNFAAVDSTEVTYGFTASGLAGTLTQVDIYLNPEHTYSGDLYLELQAPDGTFISLLENPGNASPNSGASSRHLKSIFFQETGLTCENWGGSTNPTVDSATTGEIYAHSMGYYTNTFASITGSLNGSWSFIVGDIASGDTGTIDRIVMHSVATPEPGTWAVLGLGGVAMMRRRRR